MERSRGFGFFTKRSQHYDNLQQADSQQQQKQPLKDTTNTPPKQQKSNHTEEIQVNNQEPSSTQDNDSNNQQGSRSLQCLETLAQKAGIHDITADDCKYDVANTLLNLDRGHEFIKQSVDSSGISAAMSDINKQNQPQQQIVDANAQAVQQQNQVQQQQEQQQQFQQLQQQQQQQLVQAQSPHLQQVTVNAQGQQCIQTTTNMGPPQQQQQHAATMHQQQVAQQGQVQIQTQGGQVLAATAHTGSTTITTMSPLQQGQQTTHPQQVEWGHGRVQVIQQPTQNPMYLQQLYNTQGQLLMPGNIALHPSLNPQQIQVITKPFQGNQIGAPHMLTAAQGKQVLQGSQTATFPGYATIPTIPTTQNQQTLVFSQLGVISSQPNILPNHSGQGSAQVAQQKQQEIHKVMGAQKVQMQKVGGSTGAVAQTQPQQGQCVQVSQAMIGTQPTAQIISPIQPNGQPMQFTNGLPWQFTNGLPQVWATNGIQSQALLAPNPIFIRGTQADGTPGMFIQQNPQAATIQTQQNQAIATQGTIQQVSKARPVNENIQPKQTANRPLNILPSNAATIRPASSVSTQTIGAQTPASMGSKPGAKIRTKTPQIRSPAPKADAANQTQMKSYTNIQQHHIVGNKMLVMNTSTGITTGMTPGSPMTPEKAQQIVNQQNKNQQVQVQTANQQQMQQVAMQQQQALQQQQQQQQALQYQIQQGQQPQQIQAKPMMIQTIQGIPQQQISMAGDRPIMPVVSVPAQTQQVQQQIPSNLQQGLPLQSNLAVTQQSMQMNMQQIHPQQITQLAPPGTIITSQMPPTVPVSQVVAQPSPSAQLQIAVSAAQHQQQVQQQTTQQVHPLPPVVTPTSNNSEDTSNLPQESSLPTPPSSLITVTTAASELIKESIGSEATTSPPDTKEVITTPQNPRSQNVVESACVQPIPIPGTVPSQPSGTAYSEVGLPLAVTAEEVKERCPPKAMVKPQVLTHVIEDFVIQESSEPFPVSRNGMLSDFKPSQSNYEKDTDDPPRKKRAMSPTPNSLSPKGDMAKCEVCGVIDNKSKFKKNKRFCSVACSKSGKLKDDKKAWDRQEDIELDESKTLNTSQSVSTEDDSPKVDPVKWSVQEVFEFIKNLPGCSDYAEDFLIQEIDGQALMLLKEDHLMSAMAMKLGPALKIVAKIDDMRIDKEPPKQN